MPYKFDLKNITIDPFSLQLQFAGKSFEWMLEFQKVEAKNALRILSINLGYIKEKMQDVLAELIEEGIQVDITENSIIFTKIEQNHA